MRILVISQYFWPENFRLNDLCLELTNRGHTVEVLTGIPNYPRGKYYKGYTFFNNRQQYWNGIKIHRTFLTPRGRNSKLLLILNYFTFLISSCIKIFFLKGDFDKIIVYQLSPATVGFPALIAKKIFKAPLFFYIQDLWPESIEDAGEIKSKFIFNIINYVMGIFYKCSDCIIVQSPGFIDHLISKGVNSNKILYIPNTVEKFYKPEIKLEEYIVKFPVGFNILFAGNIGKAQDLFTIIEAANILFLKGVKINWIFLGEGRDKQNIIDYIEKKGISDIFYFLGAYPTEQMPYFFACADVLLVSLKKSAIFSLTIPSKIQSYLACKKPILANIDGIGFKIISENNCGYASHSSDSITLSQNAEKLYYSSKSDLDILGLNAFNFFVSNFERNIVYNKLESILLNVK